MTEEYNNKKLFSKEVLCPFIFELSNLNHKLINNGNLNAYDIKKIDIIKSIINVYNNLIKTNNDDNDDLINNNIDENLMNGNEYYNFEDNSDDDDDDDDDNSIIYNNYKYNNKDDEDNDLSSEDKDKMREEVNNKDELMNTLFDIYKDNYWCKPVYKDNDESKLENLEYIKL